ncbi:hypothetical protein Asp14428_03370 [Actinoplanes sp. NBRC 14428]|nr:hypothetical protein Asp14428_03370 [Actinoplanes sp. NBRC 14428]
MADRQDDEFGGRQDPVLVRPYIRTEPGGAAPAGHDDRPEETWPEPAPAGTSSRPPPARRCNRTCPSRQPAADPPCSGSA